MPRESLWRRPLRKDDPFTLLFVAAFLVAWSYFGRLILGSWFSLLASVVSLATLVVAIAALQSLARRAGAQALVVTRIGTIASGALAGFVWDQFELINPEMSHLALFTSMATISVGVTWWRDRRSAAAKASAV